MEGRALAKLMNVFQFDSYQLGYIMTNYKERIARYDNEMKTEIQTWKKRIETAEAKLTVKTTNSRRN